MNCKSVQSKLIFFSDGELDSNESAIVSEHLNSCSSCSNLYNELIISLGLIKKKKTLEINPFLYTRIQQQLDVIKNGKVQVSKNRGFKRLVQPVFLSILLIAGIWSGVQLGNIAEMDQQQNQTVSYADEFYFDGLEQENIEACLLNDNLQDDD